MRGLIQIAVMLGLLVGFLIFTLLVCVSVYFMAFRPDVIVAGLSKGTLEVTAEVPLHSGIPLSINDYQHTAPASILNSNIAL